MTFKQLITLYVFLSKEYKNKQNDYLFIGGLFRANRYFQCCQGYDRARGLSGGLD